MQDGDGQKYSQDKNDKLHTRASVLPPNNPAGATANAAITAVNVTICVLLDPSQVVARPRRGRNPIRQRRRPKDLSGRQGSQQQKP